ncbi:FecCD family ABC transporter permease [Bacillus solimangrovi]|uniref:Iron-dicitrate transporter subunit FecD n=1 Tax=Bacillus solimangrovi TaxID=1305675 RepID=A0A1E5LCG4_9BACI|nr:iron chelate uptake ABC transporter family permease subunit [Bacillus solimangrovi]OEH91751.1 iron-dicitrate transporter subunit FecD [Bacillus solimangrovi]
MRHVITLKRTPKMWIWLLSILVTLFSIISIGVGAIYISPIKVIAALTGMGAEEHLFIISNYRLPRIAVALLVGSGLAISGTILQGTIRNPLASPDVIGITKGAGLAAVIVIILFPSSPTIVLPIAAFIGAALVAVALYLFSYKRGIRPATLALVGIALGAVCNAGIQYLMIKFPLDANAALVWLTGSLWGRGWDEVAGILPLVLILIPVTFIFAIKLDILNLGDDVAEGLGEHVNRSRVLMLILAVALAGVCVAIVGSIGFVGLIAPHIARQLVGAKHSYLLPISALIGILLVLLADGLGRGLIPPIEIPAGIFTAVIGAPYFLYLLRRESKVK